MVSFRQFVSSVKRKNGTTIRKLVLLGSVLAIYLLLSSSGFLATFTKVSDSDLTKLDGRDAKRASPFHWIEDRRRKAVGKASEGRKSLLRLPFQSSSKVEDPETRLLVNWSDAPKAEKCRYMIDSIYALNEGWSNEQVVKFYGEDETDDLLISLLAERLRMFDFCFISGKLNIDEVFAVKSLMDSKHESSPSDYLERVFPFLRKVADQGGQFLWPKITNMRNGDAAPVPELPANFNRNFFLNWQRMASGKGIVITLSERSKALLFKQISVFDHIGNTLPIQIVTTGNDFSQEFRRELIEIVAASRQEVYLVDCAPILDSKFAREHIGNIVNKWVAVIFNTFEELILLDVDAVPFVPMDEFLKEKSYETNGMLMYKDRSMPNEHTFKYCIDMLREVEPSYQERGMIKSQMKYRFDEKIVEETEEAAVYRGFFHELLLHHVESGLVVINKPKKLNGLLLSFLLQLDAKMNRCVYGDKEIFWLGQLFTGQDYSIHPTDGGVAGPMIEAKHDKFSIFQICATQIAHMDESHNLLWTNGGLKTCKFENGAEQDFEKNPEYFGERYQELDILKGIYSSPLNIEGIIIPDVKEKPWLQINECGSYMYCASAYKDYSKGSEKSDVGEVSVYDQATLKRIKSIVSVWNRS